MVRMKLLPVFLSVAVVASTAPAFAAASVTTHQLPAIDAEASVAACGNRFVIKPKRRSMISVAADGRVQSVPNAGSALFVFSAGDRCLSIDTSAGIVDVTDAVPSVVHGVSGTLPNAITAAARSANGSVWIGIDGSDQIGVIDKAGTVAYFDLPEKDLDTGTLVPAELRLVPDASAVPVFTRGVQLLAASPQFIWALQVSTPPDAPSYVIRIDPGTGAYQRLQLGSNRRAAGLAALADDLAVILMSNDHVLVVSPDRVLLQWELPGKTRYVAPPLSVSLVTAVPGGADIVSLKDAALWHYSRDRGMLELKAQFPGRPSWIVELTNQLVGVNTDAAEFMTTPL